MNNSGRVRHDTSKYCAAAFFFNQSILQDFDEDHVTIEHGICSRKI